MGFESYDAFCWFCPASCWNMPLLACNHTINIDILPLCVSFQCSPPNPFLLIFLKLLLFTINFPSIYFHFVCYMASFISPFQTVFFKIKRPLKSGVFCITSFMKSSFPSFLTVYIEEMWRKNTISSCCFLIGHYVWEAGEVPLQANIEGISFQPTLAHAMQECCELQILFYFKPNLLKTVKAVSSCWHERFKTLLLVW